MIQMNEMQQLLKKLEGTPEGNLLKQMMGQSRLLTRSTPGFKQIEKAQNIITKDGMDTDVYYDKPYLLTTRNQRYLDTTLPNGADSAFTILSAGDTIFELVSRGVNHIVTVDVNDLQPLVFKLRKAAIMTLKPSQFEQFLIDSKGYRFMARDVYKDVREAFDKSDEPTINFWDNIIDINPQDDLRQYLFKGIGGDISKTRMCLPFLRNKPGYYDLRTKLEKADIQIHIQDALEYLKQNPTQQFDYIDITNILLFIYQLQCEDKPEKYNEVLKTLRTIYDTNLNNGGVFVIDYLFGVGLSDLENITMEEPEKRKVQEIYKITLEKLRELFELESCTVSKLIDGFGPKQDTIIYTKK
jgi:hypothetical protein